MAIQISSSRSTTAKKLDQKMLARIAKHTGITPGDL